MHVLADLLEVTAVCISDLVRETREALEDHGHATGTAATWRRRHQYRARQRHYQREAAQYP